MSRGKCNNFILFGVFMAAYIYLFLLIFVFKYVSPMELFSSERAFTRSIDLIPFQTIHDYMSGKIKVSPIIAMANIFGNIIMFIPLGIYLQLLKKDKRLSASMLIVFATCLLIETIQYVFGIGATDIDDIILNSLGGFMGIMLYKSLLLLLKDERKVRAAIVILGLSMILLVVIFEVSTRLRGFRIKLLPL